MTSRLTSQFFFFLLCFFFCTYSHARAKERPVWLLFLARGLKVFFFARIATHVRARESEATACVVVVSGTRIERKKKFFCTYGYAHTGTQERWSDGAMEELPLPPTHMHTHTPKELDRKVFIWTSSPEDCRLKIRVAGYLAVSVRLGVHSFSGLGGGGGSGRRRTGQRSRTRLRRRTG